MRVHQALEAVTLLGPAGRACVIARRRGEIATAMVRTRDEVVVKRARNTFETFFRGDETRFRLSAMNAQFYTRDKRLPAKSGASATNRTGESSWHG
jgi:hypothetical protein